MGFAFIYVYSLLVFNITSSSLQLYFILSKEKGKMKKIYVAAPKSKTYQTKLDNYQMKGK